MVIAERRAMHIATSCDDGLTGYIPTQLVSISENLKDYEVHFWFFHFRIPAEKVEKLRLYAKSLGIEFHEVIISDTEPYDYLLSLSADSVQYPAEVFFPLCMHKHTPDSIDRILYIDAGDVVVCDDIGEFYFSDFEGNFLVVEPGFSSCKDSELYSVYDLYDRIKYIEISQEYFNAGVMLFNLEMLRRMKIDMDYYIGIGHWLRDMHGGFISKIIGSGCHFQCEQGLLAASFVGFIKFMRFFNQNTFTQYNFRPYVCECNKNRVSELKDLSLEDVKPKMIHFLGDKPWRTDAQKRKTLMRVSQEAFDLYYQYEAIAKAEGAII